MFLPAEFLRRQDDVFPCSSANSTPSNPSVVSFVRVLHAFLLSFESADVRSWFDVSWMFAARLRESVSTELHDVRRGVALCGVVFPPGGGHCISELWPQTRCSGHIREPQALIFCVFQDVMRQSTPRIVHTTSNNVLACVCFRSVACFAKQNGVLHVCGVHVGRQATQRVQPSCFASANQCLST